MIFEGLILAIASNIKNMNYRRLGKTGFKISEVSLGTWQVGGKWGSGFDDANADQIINLAIDQGTNFIDTADVYESGQSEQAVGRVVRSRSEDIYVATKCGRQISPHVNEGYTLDVLRAYVEDSLGRLGLDRIDLIQLHCPPTEVYSRPEIFGLFERLKEEGKIRHLGVSVETVDQALAALEFDNVTTVQIIFNMFRHKPRDAFFEIAKAKDIGIIVRVPLASGLLTGKYNSQTTFESGDHRQDNRNGELFDKGETFSGIPYEDGLVAVDKLKGLFPQSSHLVGQALGWVLNHEAVSCVIPGASRTDQVAENISALEGVSFNEHQLNAIDEIYDQSIRYHVHHLW